MPAPKGTLPPHAGKAAAPASPTKSRRGRPGALARFAEGNVDRLQAWLDAVAEKDHGNAADLFIRFLEYHLPKLARTELSGSDGKGGIDLRIMFIDP